MLTANFMDARFNTSPLPFAPPPPEFDDFIEGENRQILMAARALDDNDAPSPSLYVWGGGGKTHLLRMIVAMARPRRAAFYVGAEQAIPPPVPGLLAADDIDNMSEEKRLSLMDWQNKISPGGSYRILAAGNSPPDDAGLGEEIAARLSAGLVFRLRDISEEEKKRALSGYARRRGFVLPDEVIDLFLTRLPRDMTSLTAALADLDGFLLPRQKPLTLSQARQWLRGRSPALFRTSD